MKITQIFTKDMFLSFIKLYKILMIKTTVLFFFQKGFE